MLTNSLCGVLVAAVAGAAFVSSATGAVVFRDDFEGFTVGEGTYPVPDVDLDPSASVGTWLINEPVPQNVQVVRDFSPVQGAQALGLGRNNNGGQSTTAQFAPSPSSSDELLRIAFKFSNPAPNPQFSGTVERVNLIGQDRSGSGWSNQVFGIDLITGWWGPDILTATFSSKDSSMNPEGTTRADFTGVNTATGWADIEILMNFDTHTFTFSVNGVSLPNSTDVPFDATALTYTTMQQLVFYNREPNNTLFAIDDITVETVPEPTAISLALMGAATLLRRRR